MNPKKLFSEYQLGKIKLKNRVVMAPMTRSRSINNIPSELVAEYYSQRADAGLLISEGVSPSPNGLGYPRIPGIFNKEQIEGWKLVTEAVHKANSRIFIQLMHTGRVGHTENLPQGAEVLSPSEIQLSGEVYTDSSGMQSYSAPKKMTLSDIQNTVGEYVAAAKNAIDAGFDGVEIYGANGYLIEQFLNPKVNTRNDEYGGTFEKRSRFLLEIVQGIVDAIGKEKTGLRLSPYGVFNDTGEFEGIDEAYKYIVSKIDDVGLAYLHLVDHSSMGAPIVPQEMKDIFRDKFKGTFILSGGYDSEKAELELQNNKGDLVAFGRAYISNPNLVEAFTKSAKLVDPDFETFYTPGEKGYTDYPLV